jgi:hypothetical protein
MHNDVNRAFEGGLHNVSVGNAAGQVLLESSRRLAGQGGVEQRQLADRSTAQARIAAQAGTQGLTDKPIRTGDDDVHDQPSTTL